MSDVGLVNTSNYRILDAIEKSALDLKIYSKDYKAKDMDWSATMQHKVILDVDNGDKGKGKGKGKGKLGHKRVRHV